jgi:hypothetical protein
MERKRGREMKDREGKRGRGEGRREADIAAVLHSK